jgi:hypothetical protein
MSTIVELFVSLIAIQIPGCVGSFTDAIPLRPKSPLWIRFTARAGRSSAP